MRARKLIGTVIMVIVVILYALVAMAIAVRVLPGTPWWVQMGFFAIGGLVWVLPCMAIIWWMTRPDAPKR